MKLTYTVEKAIKRASILHQGQRRHGEGSFPYITHLFSVATILAHYIDDEDVIVAGLLHDTIEDTPYTVEELEQEFGKRITNIVLEVTEPKHLDGRELSWKERKLLYLDNMQRASGEALMVSAADKIHNLQSLLEDHSKAGDTFWEHFGGGQEGQLWFFGEHAGIIKERLNNEIVDEYRNLHDKALLVFA